MRSSAMRILMNAFFFLFGKVSKPKCRINELRRHITDVVTAVSQATHAMASNAGRPRHLRATNGAHVEGYRGKNALIKLTKL
jgi:hypothetical protein